MARTYRRDNRGRFSSTGRTGTGRQLAARMVSRGKNRLTRDNAGRITSVGGQGATARGGRLRTAAGNKRATQLARLKGTGGRLRKPVSSRPRISRAEPLMTGGTLASRSSLKRARQKLKENPTAAQRGAVTRANRYAAAARARDTTAKKFGRPAGVMRKRPEGQVTPPAFRSPKWAKKSEWLKPVSSRPRVKVEAVSGPKLNAFQRSDARYAKRKYGVHSTISNPGRKSQRLPRRTLQNGQRVAITGRTRKQIRRSYAKTVTNKLFDNYNRGLTRNAGPKLRIGKQALYDQFSVFGGSKTVSRSRVTRPVRRRRR